MLSTLNLFCRSCRTWSPCTYVQFVNKKHIYELPFNSLPKNKILDRSKLKAFADDNLYIAQMMIDVFDREERIVGKGQNAGHQHFLLFQ